MSHCEYRDPQGGPSLLYAQLEQKYGTEQATQYWYMVQHLRDEWGNQEPSLTWVQERLGMADDVIVKQVSLGKGRTNTVASLEKEIKDLIEEAKRQPSVTYQVPFNRNTPGVFSEAGGTRIGMRQIAQLFARQSDIPANIQFTPSFQEVLTTLPSVFLQNWETSAFSSPALEEKRMEDQRHRLYVALRNVDGTPTGSYFDYTKQQEAIDSLLYIVYDIWRRSPGMKQSELIHAVRNKLTAYQNINRRISIGESVRGFEDVDVQTATNRIHEVQMILNSLYHPTDSNNLWVFLTQKLRAYGLTLRIQPTTESLDENGQPMIEDGEQGRGLEDYYDQSFEHDPKDTASTRLKLWLATIEQAEDLRMTNMSFSDALVREEFIEGTRDFTLRTPEQVAKLKLEPGRKSYTRINGQLFAITNNGVVTEDNIGTIADLKVDTEPKVGMTLFRLEKVQSNAEFAVSQNYLGLAKLVDFEKTFQLLINTLGDMDPILYNEDGLGIMNVLATQRDPVLKRVYQKLQRELQSNKDIVNEFVSVMTNQYQKFMVGLWSPDKGKDGITYRKSRMYSINQAGELETILKEWRENQKSAPIAMRSSTGDLIVSPAVLAELNEKWEAFRKLDNPVTATAAGKELMKFFLDINGIDLPAEFIENFAQNAEKLTKKRYYSGSFLRQFAMSKEGNPLGMMSALIHSMVGNEANGEEDYAFEVRNPMYNQDTALKSLASLAKMYISKPYSTVSRSSDGKTIYDHGMPSKLSHRFRKLVTDQAFRDRHSKTLMGRSNFLLRSLNDPDLRAKMSLVYLEALKQDNAKNKDGVHPVAQSLRERLLYSMLAFEKKGNSKYADYVGLTVSDKKHTYMVMNGPRIDATMVWQGQLTLSNKMAEELAYLYISEHSRITGTAETQYNDRKFEKGKGKFILMPEFNFAEMADLVKSKVISQATMDAFWTRDGILKPLNSPGQDEGLLSILNAVANRMSNYTESVLRREGLVQKNQLPVSKNYAIRLMRSAGYVYDQGKFFMGDTPLSNQQVEEAVTKLAARDYTLNHFLFQASFAPVMFGDPAQFWKGSTQNTMVEYEKRLAKEMAPGSDGNWSHSPAVSYLVMKDVEGGLPEVTGNAIHTDAQEFITVQEWLDTQFGLGTIKQQVYDEMTRIVKNPQEGPTVSADPHNYTFTDPEHLKVIMQIQKPVYSWEAPQQDGNVILHAYIKSSAMVLHPDATRGNELDKLRVWMESNNVGRAAFESAVKAGVPTVVADVFGKDGTVHIGDFSKSTLTLSREGWRVQQRVPFSDGHEEISLVSQMNKTLFQGIPDGVELAFQGNIVTAKELRERKEELRVRMVQKSMNALRKRLETDGEIAPEKLVKELMREILTRTKGYTPNDLEILSYMEKGELLYPLFYAPSLAKFEPLMLSLVTSATKLTLPGRSYIQVSPAGARKDTELTAAERSKIVYLDSYDGGYLKTLRNEDGVIKPAQVLVPFQFYHNGKLLNIEDFVKVVNGRRVIDTEKLDPELLKMIGARIPNQGHSSQLPIEIVGFIPYTLGDAIIIPAAVTQQMGSDFDVDKLYCYIKPYKLDGKSLKVDLGKERLGADNEEWLSLKAATVALLKAENIEPNTSGRYPTPLFNEFLAKAVDAKYPDGNIPKHMVSGEENRDVEEYFDMHWAVLTHPEMLDKVRSPLDKPDLKLEADNAAQDQKENYFHPVRQVEDYIEQRDAKNLVGQSSLAVTFNAGLENLYMPLFKYVFDNTENKMVQIDMELKVEVGGSIIALSNLGGRGRSYHSVLQEYRTKHDNHVILQNAFLDNAKNPYAGMLNINAVTYPAAMAIIQMESVMQESLGIEFVAALMQQPVIKEYVARKMRSSDSLERRNTEDIGQALYSEYVRQYEAASLAEGMSETDPDVLNYDLMREVLEKGIKEKTADWYDVQKRALEFFLKALSIGGSMQQLQRMINYDTKGAGKDVLSLYAKRSIFSDLQSKYIAEGFGIDQMDSLDKTEAGKIAEFVQETANDIIDALLPYNTQDVFKTIEGIAESLPSKRLSSATLKEIIATLRNTNVLRAAVLTGLITEPAKERVRLLYNEKGNESLAKRVQKAKKTWGKNNYFVQRLQTALSVDGLTPDYVTYSTIRVSELDETETVRGWLELLSNGDQEQKQLGEDLIRYTILTDINGILGRHLPVSYLLGIGVGEELRRMPTVSGNEVEMLIRHNPYLAPQLSDDAIKALGGWDYPPSIFNLTPKVEGEPYDFSSLMVSEGGKLVYPKFISFWSFKEKRWFLYERTESAAIAYKRTHLLGNERMYEFGAEESILSENRIPGDVQTIVEKEELPVTINKAGSEEEIRGWLEKISMDPQSTQAEAELANLFQDLDLPAPIQDTVKRPLTYRTVTGTTRAMALEHEADRSILVLHKEIPAKMFRSALIHEITHYYTARMTRLLDAVVAPEAYKSTLLIDPADIEKALVQAQGMYSVLKIEYPKAAENLSAIDNIRKQALELLRKEMLQAGLDFQEFYDTIHSSKFDDPEMRRKLEAKDPNNYRYLIYHLGSNTEFVAGVWSDIHTIRFLNRHTYEGKETNLLAAFIERVSRLIAAIAEMAGVTIQRGSLLEAGVKATFKLITDEYVSNFDSVPRPPAMLPPTRNNTIVEAAGRTDKIIERLKKQREQLRQTYTGVTNRSERARKRKMLTELEDQIQQLETSRDLSLVAGIGQTHLKWVKDTLQSSTSTPNRIITAQNILSTWKNLMEYMGGDLDPAWKELQGTAISLSVELNKRAIQAHLDTAKNWSSIKLSDYTTAKDASQSEVLFRSLSAAAESKLVQAVGQHIETTGRIIDEDVFRFVKRTVEFEKEIAATMQKKGKTVQDFYNLITKDGKNWGLVTPYSEEWHKFVGKQRGRLFSELAKIKERKLLSTLPTNSKADTQLAWRSFWTAMTGWDKTNRKYIDNPKAVVVDVRKLFDMSGKELDTATEERQRLVKMIGEDAANRAIEAAHRKVLDYLQDQSDYEDSLIADKNDGILTEAQMLDALQEFHSQYSPFRFLHNLTEPIDGQWENTTERYVVFAPVAKEFYDDRYTTLKNDPELFQLYSRYRDEMERLKSFLPIYTQDKLKEDFLPVVEQSLIDDVLSVPEYLKKIPENIVKSLTASGYEEQMKQFDKIPLQFIAKPREDAQLSKDPLKVMKLFGAMAIHYHHFANAKDTIELGKGIMQALHADMINDPSRQTPNGLRNSLDALKYMEEYMIYKHPKALEGNTGEKIYSINPVKQAQITKELRGINTEIQALDRQFADGDIELEEYAKRHKELGKKLEKYDGRTIYGSKLGDSLIRFAQLKALSFNPFSAFANLSFGMVSAAVHAAGEKDFSYRELGQAFRLVMNSTKRWITFGSATGDTAEKILNLMDRLGVMGDVVDSHYGKMTLRDEKAKWKRVVNPYQWLRSGDYFVRAITTVAMALKTKVQVDGKEVSLWEAHDKEGIWDAKQFGERPEWYSETAADQAEWNKFRNRVIRVNIIVMGNADKNSPKMVSKFILGRLLGQFRASWLPEGWYNRFGSERDDDQLGRTIKGRYITYKDLGFAGSLKVIVAKYIALVSKANVYDKTTDKKGNPLKDVDIENMNRNFAELNFALMVSALIFLLSHLQDDDDDERSRGMKMLQVARNLMMRTNQDIRFYSSPEVFDTLTRDIIPSLNVIRDFGRLGSASWKVVSDEEYEFDRWLKSLFRAGLPIPQATIINKLDYMMNKDLENLGR